MSLKTSLNRQGFVNLLTALAGAVFIVALIAYMGFLIGTRSTQSGKVPKTTGQQPSITSYQLSPTPALESFTPTPTVSGEVDPGTRTEEGETHKSDEEVIVKAATEFLNQQGFPMGVDSIPSTLFKFPDDRYFEIEKVRVDTDSKQWATVTVVQKYRESRSLVPTQPTFLLGHRMGVSWQFALPNMSQFAIWLSAVPSALISEEEKSVMRDVLNLK